jgi:hypothetical protein
MSSLNIKKQSNTNLSKLTMLTRPNEMTELLTLQGWE